MKYPGLPTITNLINNSYSKSISIFYPEPIPAEKFSAVFPHIHIPKSLKNPKLKILHERLHSPDARLSSIPQKEEDKNCRFIKEICPENGHIHIPAKYKDKTIIGVQSLGFESGSLHTIEIEEGIQYICCGALQDIPVNNLIFPESTRFIEDTPYVRNAVCILSENCMLGFIEFLYAKQSKDEPYKSMTIYVPENSATLLSLRSLEEAHPSSFSN